MPAKQSDPITLALGEKVQKLRKLRKWSQTDLADEMAKQLDRPVDQTLVTRLEKGRRNTSLDDLAALSRIFGVPMVALDARVDPFNDHDADFYVSEARAALQAARVALEEAAQIYGAAAAQVVNCGDDEPEDAQTIVVPPQTEGWNNVMDQANG
jgi:transcriptional regulator with XRE-family HTH domain